MKYLLLLLVPYLLQGLTIFDLDEQFENQKVSIVGFLVQDSEQRWFLSQQPRIKSCCAGKGRQVALEGEFSKTLLNRMVQMEGIFHKTGDLFTLEQSKLLGRESHLALKTEKM